MPVYQLLTATVSFETGRMTGTGAWLVVLVLVTSTSKALGQGAVCPGYEQSYFSLQCLNNRTCGEDGFWEEDVHVCQMCAGCVYYLEPGDICVTNTDCMPGYSCKEDPKDKKYKCKLDDANSCVGKALSGYDSWTPRCIGTDYAPIQCKGDKPTGKCFCVDVNGKRIFGEALWSEASNMTCACSRRVEELRANGRLDVTLHCDTQGNFEELQCDNGVCWCAEERTGVPKSRVLPEGMMKTLPCYNATLVGSKYLRQCESQQVAQARVIREMAAHKANNPNFPYTNCDLDGSYGAVQQDTNTFYCAWKDKTRIEGYSAEYADFPKMNCRCARDKKIYGDSVMQKCSGSGNYESKQYTNNGTVYCVDEDGFLDNTACT
ncbi:uncharacterized protein [Periplaneta americana]|uniref:uncharacterized protein n=1 Tax=Periplaneta americana TaxID=6978 RepID=UPI0037E8DA98